MDTLQKAVGEIRKELTQKKGDSKTEDGTAANSTPNLSPTGGTTASRDDSRPGTHHVINPSLDLHAASLPESFLFRNEAAMYHA